jgi:UDP-N-acetylglucosamine--N-acetylmuramyl-(pentapeptide) pyrophosphoryl-undecaprenol N-acetylglucosamine transferase
MKILIAGGGTGGHIFPGIAIAQAIHEIDQSVNIEFVGTAKGAEAKLVPAENYKLNLIEIAGFNRSNWKANLAFPVKLINGFRQSLKLLNEFKPDAVIATGGYVAGPVTRLAQWKKIKTFVQEQNAVPGFTTKELSKKANRIFITYEKSIAFFGKSAESKIICAGNPVRKNLNSGNKEEALKHFGLQPNRIVILVIGGSLGARSINQAVSENYLDWIKRGYQIIWQTGKTDHEFAPIVDDYKPTIFRSAFINEMNLAYAAADLVISRAGATSLAEITYCGKASILAPFPFAADDHQTKNAEAMKSAGASFIIKDDQLSAELGNTVNQILSDPGLLGRMRTASGNLAKPDAAKEIATQILKDIGKN